MGDDAGRDGAEGGQVGAGVADREREQRVAVRREMRRGQRAGESVHAELGETVLKVRANDTIKIFDGFDHAQCAAPGYGMYYAWVIRHLPEAPYIVPEFTAEHAWTMEKDARFWWPAEIAPYG